MSLFRRFTWWLRPERKEADLGEELQFHLDQEARERRDAGLSEAEARSAAHRDLGNEARLREDVRAVWTWRPLDELAQDLRYAVRTLFKQRAVTLFVLLSLALGIGANTAIYSFMDALLVRALPVPDPESLVVFTWQSKAFDFRKSGPASEFVMHSIEGSTYRNAEGTEARIFPLAAFERLREVSSPVLSSMFVRFPAGQLNVVIQGAAELAEADYVSGDFFAGIGAPPGAGRLLGPDDDRPGAPPVAMISAGYAQRRFGSAAHAVGQPILINNLPFTVVGVTAPEFYGVDPGSARSVFLPLQTNALFDPDAAKRNLDQNYYWAGILGRLRPGVTRAQAEASLAAPFLQWAATTAATEGERINLPMLRLAEGAGGLDTLRRRYSKPLYVLLAMVGLILAIACANTANLLLARAAARQREIAVRLSVGAGRFRLVRQLLTESLVLAICSGALGIAFAFAGTRILAALLASGDDGLTIAAELNANVLLVTLALSVICGVCFGLLPAMQATRPALIPALKDAATGFSSAGGRHRMPRVKLQQGLVVAQIALLMLLMVGAGLFARTLSNLQSIPLGFNAADLLLFDLNAPQAGLPQSSTAAFYTALRQRLSEIAGVRAVTVSHSSLVRAGRGHPVSIDGVRADGTRLLQTGPAFFSTLQIPMLAGREIDERDRAGALPVAVISDLFARRFLPNQNPIGRTITIGGSLPMQVEVIGVAATARYGGIKQSIPPVLYVAYPQIPRSQLQGMTFVLRSDGDPLRHVATVRRIVQAADTRVPLTNVRTQADEIAQTINQEIVLARLAGTFAVLALVIACVGLYGTMAYGVARRTREIGVRIALGARHRTVIWMVLREVCVLTALGLAISIPIARGMARFVGSFLFDMQPNDPRVLSAAVATLVAAALAASYGPARRATRIDPTTALREE